MKKLFYVVFTLIVVALSCVACQTAPEKMEPYLPPINNSDIKVTVDEGFKIDGVLDEQAWTESKNVQTVNSKIARGGKMEVMTYFGENAVYFAFNVEDDDLRVLGGRSQNLNTGVELYFSNLDVPLFAPGCYSLRITPLPDGNDTNLIILGYGLTRWVQIKNEGYCISACTTDGTFNGSTKDKGYTVELAMAYELLGGKTDYLQYTASFIQTSGNFIKQERDANTFLESTHYLRPGTWIAVSNDGNIDKKAIVDAKVTPDASMTIDGKLDESVWTDKITNEKGKKFTYIGKQSTLTGAEYSIYTHLTDLGVYIGLDSTDKYVFSSPDRPVKYDTGMELFIAAKGNSKYKTDSVKQIRFSVGGRAERFDSYPASSGLWAVGMFPLKAAGFVKGGEINSSETEGWQGEIFVPWSSLGVISSEEKKQISVLPIAVYHSTNTTATDGNTAGYKYINSADSALYKNSTIDIQTTYLYFNKDGYAYNNINVFCPDVNVNDVEEVYGEDCYFVDVKASIKDVINKTEFSSNYPEDVVDEIIDENECVKEFEYLGNDIYRLYISQSSVDKMKGEGCAVTFKNEEYGLKKEVKLLYDTNATVDGVIDASDVVISQTKENGRSVVVSTNIGAANFEIDLATAIKDGYVYFAGIVKDATIRNNSGLDLYFSSKKGVYVGSALRIKALADGSVTVYSMTGSTWKENVGLAARVKTLLVTIADGYVVEGRFPIALIGEEESEAVWVCPTITLCPNSSKTTMHTMLGRRIMKAEYALEGSSYLRFTEEGFTPDSIYALKESITLYDGKNLSGSVETGYTVTDEVMLSYLNGGGLTSDFAKTVSLTTEAGESLPTSYKISDNDLTTSITLNHAIPNRDGFNDSKVDLFMNFDHGAENLVGNTYANFLEVDASPSIAINPDEKDYEGDKSYNANMRTRWIRVPYEVGNNSFTVSMTINYDAIRKYPTSQYHFILFGTGNVDNGEEGFSVRVGGEGWSIRVPGASYTTNVGIEKFRNGGYNRVTVSVEQTKTGATFSIWLEDEFIFSKDMVFSGSLDIPEYGKLGLGGPGSYKETASYPAVTVNMDDVIIFRDIIRKAQNIYDMCAYIDEMNERSHFGINAREFNLGFDEFDSVDQIEREFTIGSNEGIEFGGEWAEYITEVGGGVYKLILNKENAKKFTNEEVCSYTLNGITKYAKVTYLDLGSVQTDSKEYSFWVANTTDEYYEIQVKVTTESGIEVIDGNGVTFGSTKENLVLGSKDTGKGNYLVRLNKSVADSESEIEMAVFIAGNDAVKPYAFTLKKQTLSADEKTALKNKTLAYLNYDGDNGISNLVGGSTNMTVSVNSTNGIKERSGSNKYFEAGTENNRMAIKGINFGKEDFTISFDAKIDAASFDGTNATYELISSTTGTVDQHISSFQISMLGEKETMRIQVGRNDGSPYSYTDTVNVNNGGVRLDEWVRYTVVVDRNYATHAGRTKWHKHYLADGSYSKECNVDNVNGYRYSVEEDVAVSVYVNGVLMGTNIMQLSGQDIGYDGTLYVGGNFGWGSKNLISGIDNIVVCSGIMTEREMLAAPFVCKELFAN